MSIFKSFSQIVSSMIETLSLTQPNLDTKPGTVSRDLFIDLQADQLDKLYKVAGQVSDKQSPERMFGLDLEKWASNFSKKKKDGSSSSGIVVFTFNDLNSDIPIPEGTIVTSRSGISFKTIGNYNISLSEKSRYAANASRMKSALNIAGINDLYAIEVPVQCLRNGRAGNISSLQVTEHNLQDSLRVINLTSFSGGENQESDSAFLARVISSFSGSATGTSFGYRSSALNVPGVNDVLIAEPGNTLMLRDGTETIETDDGSYRILSSGTGGKVDIYILGRQLQEVSQTITYTDKSGRGDATDERNNVIPGVSSSDLFRTSQERRVRALSSGQLPFQPIDSVVSIVGSISGLLFPKTTDAEGNVFGNYEIEKDLNPDTGGSPFGYDKIKFISSEKNLIGQTTLKKVYNSIDAMKYSDITRLEDVYQNVAVTKESSRVSPVDRSIIYLNHKPAVNASRVVNRTTGEIYTIVSQNVNSDTGVNDSGTIKISGKTLPSSADILSVDYVWQCSFDRFVDYNGEKSPAIFIDESVSDSIDWGVSNGIFSEPAEIYKEIGESEYLIDTNYNVSRVVSVYSVNEQDLAVSFIQGEDGVYYLGVEIPVIEDEPENILSIKSESGVELFATSSNDGYFLSRSVFLPSDSSAVENQSVKIRYNKIEFFNIPNNDGSISTSTITLPSEDILNGNGILSIVDAAYLSTSIVYVDYIADIQSFASASLASFPLSGSDISNSLFDSDLTEIAGSSSPVIWGFDGDNVISVDKFGPTRIKTLLSGSARPGKLKIVGTTLTRVDIVSSFGNVYFDGKFNLQSDIVSKLGISNSAGYYIARVDSIKTENMESINTIGITQQNSSYSLSVAYSDSSYGSFEFSPLMGDVSPSSGTKISFSILVAKEDDFEELYFPNDLTIITDKVFARIDRVLVSSGFRANNGDYVGTVTLSSFSQPVTNSNYLVDYKFTAPKEGERLNIRYTVNGLISDVTLAVENVRTVTADVLVKESAKLPVDVFGEIIINEDQILNSQSIIDNANNAVTSLLSTNSLGTTIDYSDIISTITGVAGIDSVNISGFNESGKTGRRSFIKALDNQNIIPGQVAFRAVKRRDFRIS